MLAVWLALSKFFSPSDLESSAFIPTPVPAPTAIRSVCSGKAMETAVSAFSDSMATKTLSTMLYKACTSMEIIIGRDMFSTSFPTGIVPILFSAIGADVLF